ncbi:hypothetical protein R6Y95_02755 [Methanoculleus palmolei]|jgi:hypothetical protein|uniref:Archaeal Type IV pilin N-terminal domain-containing protein n=1 Tax=Methanoculleus palmolei TaxID=72612 RepID=A0ABD8AB03_9EURY|nr:hypothetical protein R6Y95_02755 [Methanoculleus palmolei]
MGPNVDRRLIIVGILAFIGVVLLVATVVLTCTAIFTRVETSSGFPVLYISEVRGEHLQNASIIHLTEKDFEQYPALDSVIRGDNRDPGPWKLKNPSDDPDERVIGSVAVPYVERDALIELSGMDLETRKRPYFEYEGAYYYTLVSIP